MNREDINREDIIRLAREAGLAYGSDEKPMGSVKRFAALVFAAGADAEREACALLCKTMGAEGYGWVSITEAIRARGKA